MDNAVHLDAHSSLARRHTTELASARYERRVCPDHLSITCPSTAFSQRMLATAYSGELIVSRNAEAAGILPTPITYGT